MKKRGENVSKDLKHIAKKSDKPRIIPRHRRNNLILSFVGLVVAVATMFSTTFSWYSTKESTINSLNYKLDCSKGLRVNDSGTSDMHFQTVDKYLYPASSVDGRNLYFPTDGSDFSMTTSQMTFRNSTVGDKNNLYIQIDASLTAQQNHTSIYLDDSVDDTGIPKTSIMVKGKNEPDSLYSTTKAAPIRMAIWTSTAEDNDRPNTPIVFNPLDKTVYTPAVADVDRSTGAYISNGQQVAHKFSEYASGQKPLATLSKGVDTKVSVILWLEGADPKCSDKIKDSLIRLRLAFTTSWDNTQTIRFKDNTDNEWVKALLNRADDPSTDAVEKPYNLELHYDENINSSGVASGDTMDFSMYKYLNQENTDEWSCNIPGDMKKYITFVLRPPTGSNEPTYKFTVNSKNTSANTYDRGSSRMYVAEKAKPTAAANYGKCTGYWMPLGDSDGGGHDGGDDEFDGDDF